MRLFRTASRIFSCLRLLLRWRRISVVILLLTCASYCCLVRFYFVIVDLAVVLQSEMFFDSRRVFSPTVELLASPFSCFCDLSLEALLRRDRDSLYALL